MTRWLLALVVASMAVPAIAGPAEPTVLKVEPFRRSVAVRVEIGGKERLLQFDTGGGVTFISPEIAKELGCEKGGRLVGYRMTSDRLESGRCDNVRLMIGGHRFTAPVVGVYDVGPLNTKTEKVQIDGLLALDIFNGRTITLDFAGGRIVLETPDSARARTAQATELPARIGRDLSGRATAVYLDVPSKVGTLEFELDSGNGGTLLIAKPYAAAFGFDPDKGPRIGSFDIGKGLAASGFVMPAGITLDGNLGMPFLKDYLVTLDLAAGRVWLARNPVKPPAGMGVPPPPPPR